MNARLIAASSLALIVSVAGCHSSTRTEKVDETHTSSATVRREADTVNDRIAAVQGAKSPVDEAEALRQLRKYETDHGLTYTVRTFRTFDGTEVPGSSLASQPVRAQVTIYRGREVLQSFNFIPRDNRNLAILGE